MPLDDIFVCNGGGLNAQINAKSKAVLQMYEALYVLLLQSGMKEAEGAGVLQ